MTTNMPYITQEDLKTAERLALLEFKVDEIIKAQQRTTKKLDELLELRTKGMGAFWLASSLVGTGILGALALFFDWFK